MAVKPELPPELAEVVIQTVDTANMTGWSQLQLSFCFLLLCIKLLECINIVSASFVIFSYCICSLLLLLLLLQMNWL